MNSRPPIFICWAIIVIFMVASHRRIQVWQSEITLWEDAASKSPEKPRPQNRLGGLYSRAGDLDKAVQAYSSILKMPSATAQQRAEAYGNLASLVLVAKGDDITNAAILMKTALQEAPVISSSLAQNWAIIALRAGNPEGALQILDSEGVWKINGGVKVIQIDRDQPEFHFNRGEVLRAMHRCDEALREYAEYRKWFPEWREVLPC